MKFPPLAVIGGLSPRQGMIPCTLNSGYYLTRRKNNRPLLPGRNGKLAATVLLARRLKAAIPDAKHPGKAEKIPEGKARFPSG